MVENHRTAKLKTGGLKEHGLKREFEVMLQMGRCRHGQRWWQKEYSMPMITGMVCFHKRDTNITSCLKWRDLIFLSFFFFNLLAN